MLQGKHASKLYEQQLTELHTKLIAMAERVAELLETAKQALENPEKDFSLDAKTTDQQINELDFSTQDLVTEIVTKHDVYADELRFILTSIKVASYFERMGDLVKSTIKRIYKVGKNLNPETAKSLKQIADMNLAMIESLIKIIEVIDEEETQKIWESDDILDEKYSLTFKAVQSEIAAKPELIKPYTHLMLISRNLERVGDYTGSIAKIMYYVKSGKAVTKSVAKLMSKKDDIVS